MKPIKIAEKYFEEKHYDRLTCCICGCEFYAYSGKNPYPVVDDDESVCCGMCERLFVIPARNEERG
jgi:hypothetical protein